MYLGEFVNLELDLPIDLAEADRLLGPWLWSVVWPVTAGDLRALPPTLVAGLPPTPALLALPGADEHADRIGGMVIFRDPDGAALGDAWIVSVGDQRPALLAMEARPEGCRLHLGLHPALAADASARRDLDMSLWGLPLAVPGMGLRVPTALAPEVKLLEVASSAQAVCTESDFRYGFHWQASGVATSPRADAHASWQGRLLERAVEAVRDGAYAQDGPARRSLLGRLARWRASRGALGRGGPPPCGLVDESFVSCPRRGRTRPEQTVERRVERGLLARRSRRSERVEAPIETLIPLISSEARAGRLSLGAVGAPLERGSEWAPLTGDILPTSLLYLGPEHLGALVHERLLTHGPWKVERTAEGGALILLHHPRAPESAAQQQLELALPALQALLLPRSSALPEGLAEYDPDTRTVIVRPAERSRLAEELAQVVAFARSHAADPRRTVERVLAPIEDPALARLWSPHLWLRGIQVWTVLDGRWVRIDEGCVPTWGPPAWVGWDGG